MAAEAISKAQATLACLLVVGLFVRGHTRTWPVFTALILVGGVFDWWLVLVGRSRQALVIWLAKELLQGMLQLILGVEILRRVFGPFRGARRTARFWLVVVLVGLGISIIHTITPIDAFRAWLEAGFSVTRLHSIPQLGDYRALVEEGLPIIQIAAAWQFGLLALCVFWYSLPLKPDQRAILLGLLIYFCVFGITIKVVSWFGWRTMPFVNVLLGIQHAALLGYWLWVLVYRWPPKARLVAAP